MWQKVRTVLQGALVALPLVAVVMSLACSSSSNPLSTSPNTLPSCQVNNSAEVSFLNKSVHNTTYDIIWDGVFMTTLRPTERSEEYTVTAGVAHTLRFRITNSSQDACTISHPSLIVCSTNDSYSCTG